MRIIGIDPGLARVGYGIIEIENESKKLLDCGVIETGKDKKEEDRLYEIFQDLNELINHWNPTACLLYTSPSPRDSNLSRMPSSA